MDGQLAVAIPSRAGHGDVRRNNLEVVLRHLSMVGTDSRASIAARTGLTPSTVSRLVGELMDLGLVREAGADGDLPPRRPPGRPATLLKLDGRHVLALGAEINVDYIAVLGNDLAGRKLHETRRPFDAVSAGPERSAEALASLCGQVTASVTAAASAVPVTVAGLTVAVPGLVDVASGVVTEAPNLHWAGFPLAAALAALPGTAGVPVSIGNDANLGALAEYRVGSHAGVGDLIYVTGEVGIGGGVIAGGRPLLGSHGHGGEIGHMNLDPAGPRCGCGRRGCWEALIGLGALLRATSSGDAALPARVSSPEAKVADVASRARAGEHAVLAALAELGHWIGAGAANLVNLFDPQAIILGGYFRQIAEWILPPATKSLHAGVLAPGASGCELTTSALGFTAATRGGALRVIDQVLTDPTRLPAAHPDRSAGRVGSLGRSGEGGNDQL
ncbi:MAG: ROK family transcriptional regulator [Actinobacteria bacterium]|nr:ROK family transcriptional regulator [Actinomycetota bacterium]